MIGSQGTVVRPHGNCLSLLAHPHTQRVFIIASLCICPFFTQQLSTLHRTSTCMWRSVGHLPSSCFAVVQLFSHVWLFVTPWTAACQASLCNPGGLQHSRLPCPSPSPRTCPNYVHWVGDIIQPSYPLSSPSPPAYNLSQHQGLFQWVGSLHQVLELQFQHQCFQWIFRVDFL